MTDIKVLGSHTLHRVLEAGIPSVCKNEVTWRRVECLPIELAVAEHSGVVDGGRPVEIGVDEATLMVANCQQDDG